MTHCRASLLIVACVVLGLGCPSCVLSAPPLLLAESNPGRAEVEYVLEYYTALRSLSAEALQQERTQQEQAFAYTQSSLDRLRLICVLSVSATSLADVTQALALLQVYLQVPESQPASLQGLAMLLWQMLHNQEQRDVYAALNKKLQDSLIQQEKTLVAQQHMQHKLQEELSNQKLLTNAAQKQLQDAVHEKERQSAVQRQLNKKLQDEKKNVRKLQEKIEQIQDIEKSLMERERTDNKGT
ncbi:MAG: hypothetical protein AB7N91_23105 [Candidatus Tectimicrobiota bacterium]